MARKDEWFLGRNRGNIHDLAHAAVDAGADLVLGHGPHVLAALERYKSRLIVYSMGNFSTYGPLSRAGTMRYGALFEIELARDGVFRLCRVVGTVQRDKSVVKTIVPAPDPANHAFRLVRTLTEEDFPESGLRFVEPDRVEPRH